MNKYFQHFLSIKISNTDKISGWIIYPIGDLIAQLVLGDVSLLRLLIIALVGRYVYAIETPKWFGFLATWKRALKPTGIAKFFWEKQKDGFYFSWLSKTLGSTFWFNPLWIARHMLVLELANIITGTSSFFKFLPQALHLGSISFVMQFPVAIVVNYIIICRLDAKSRFIWASIFSGTLSIYYAVVRVYF